MHRMLQETATDLDLDDGRGLQGREAGGQSKEERWVVGVFDGHRM